MNHVTGPGDDSLDVPFSRLAPFSFFELLLYFFFNLPSGTANTSAINGRDSRTVRLEGGLQGREAAGSPA